MKDIGSARYAHAKNIRHRRLDSSVQSDDSSDAKLKWEPAIIFSMESRNSNDDCPEDDQQESRVETNTSERDVFDSIEADTSREAGPCSKTQSLEDRYNEPKMKASIHEIEWSDTKLTRPLSSESDGKGEHGFEQVDENDEGQKRLCMQISTSPSTQKSVIEGKIPELMLLGKLSSQEQDASDQFDNFPHDEQDSQQSSMHTVKLSCDGDQGSESGFLPLSSPKVALSIDVGSICEEEHPIQFKKDPIVISTAKMKPARSNPQRTTILKMKTSPLVFLSEMIAERKKLALICRVTPMLKIPTTKKG
jgi:hypothetical protein